MVKIVVKDRKTTVEMHGTYEEVINDALNAIGNLYLAINKRLGHAEAIMFLGSIPETLKLFAEETYHRTGEAQEDKHENDAL